jgi:hypothetical protein
MNPGKPLSFSLSMVDFSKYNNNCNGLLLTGIHFRLSDAAKSVPYREVTHPVLKIYDDYPVKRSFRRYYSYISYI